ncbi:hypothetical protein ACGFY7_06360 [Streptomyces prunicolor]|uniref:hypothetical protein n=1 Tax=Streptomyces prunicolor TaxID=67348 RepID=UPI0037129E79
MPSSRTTGAAQRGSGGSAGGSDPALDRLGRDIRAFLDSDIDELLGQGRLKEADGQITAVE